MVEVLVSYLCWIKAKFTIVVIFIIVKSRFVFASSIDILFPSISTDI